MREIRLRAFDKEDNRFRYYDISIGEIFIDPNCEPLQQFTGLKDKNGEEIYEGDVISWKWHPTDAPTIEIVQWHSVLAGFEPFCFYDGDCDGVPTKVIGDWEVIGNIYENPGLLKP